MIFEDFALGFFRKKAQLMGPCDQPIENKMLAFTHCVCKKKCNIQLKRLVNRMANKEGITNTCATLIFRTAVELPGT